MNIDDDLNNIIQDLDIVYNNYNKVENDYNILCYLGDKYNEFNNIYISFHSSHSPAYKSGSIWYIGENLPIKLFFYWVMEIIIIIIFRIYITNHIVLRYRGLDSITKIGN